jgi:hypothetical protein
MVVGWLSAMRWLLVIQKFTFPHHVTSEEEEEAITSVQPDVADSTEHQHTD